MKLIRLLANLGYGSRRQVEHLLRRGRVTLPDGTPLGSKDSDPGGDLVVDGQPLDARSPLLLMLHKPAGTVCTRAQDEGQTVYDLLPSRFAARRPVLAPVGRLDKDTTGLLLMTDDGALLHRLTAPRHHVPKVYLAHLAHPLRGDEAAVLAAGRLRLRGEEQPLRPAALDVIDPTTVRVTVTEGRYHLVRRMWAALGNRVVDLHRERVGELTLGDLQLGCWQRVDDAQRAALLCGGPGYAAPDAPD